jgi:hypothetical protein
MNQMSNRSGWSPYITNPERAAHWTLPLVGEMVGCMRSNARGGSSLGGFVTLKE